MNLLYMIDKARISSLYFPLPYLIFHPPGRSNESESMWVIANATVF